MAVVLLPLLIVMEEVARLAILLMLALPVELAIIEVADEEVAREVVGKAVREVVGEATMGMCKAIAAPMVASPKADCMAGIFVMVIEGSDSWLRGSQPCASYVLDSFPGRSIDYFT